MTPSLISFVGVDHKTDQEAILALQDTDFISFESKEPTFEWGVLVSPERAGKQNRYPSIDFAQDFIQNNGFGTSARSIHLCGKAVDDYLFSPNSEIGFFASHAIARLQLNFAIDKYNLDEITDIIINRLVYERHELILQYNKSKQKFVDNLLQKMRDGGNDPATVNLSILYDGSGGFGKVIEKFEPPINGCYTGYAGGLKPDNVGEIIKNIGKIAGDQEYYIDMESGIRTDDFLDLEKCKSIISTVKNLSELEIFE